MKIVNILDETVAAFVAFVARELQRRFGLAIGTHVFGSITVSDLCAALCLVLLFLILHEITALLIKSYRAREDSRRIKSNLLGALGKPLYLLIWVFGVYISMTPFLLRLPKDQLSSLRGVFNELFDFGIFIALAWLFVRLTHVLERQLQRWTAKTENKLDDLLVPLAGKILRTVVPVVGIIFILPILNLPPTYFRIVGKGGSILLIVAVTMVLYQAVNTGEKFLLAEYDIAAADNLQARKIYTQVHVLSRTLYFVITLLSLAFILTLFDAVRRLGTSLLASAGLAGAILGFAAQKTIANLFAGFQVAMTQPIRLDDVVIVEGEWGRIEEITLTYVVVHIWDDRRLVVPLSYFIEKPFQNWTRSSARLIGSIFIFVDYSLPLDEARAALKNIIENHPLWDKRFWNLQVTDTGEKTMQLRVLATSGDSSKSWDLRCAIREQFIGYIQKNYPQCLPRLRAEIESAQSKKEPQGLPSVF